MVQVSRLTPRDEHGFVDAQAWLTQAIARYPQKQTDHPIRRAFNLIEQADDASYYPGWTCMAAGLEMASVLSELNASIEAICAALILPFMLQNIISPQLVSKSFNADVASILEGVLQMRKVLYDDKEMSKAIDLEGLKKMLIAMINDVRVVLVRLVEQVCLMRITKDMDEDTRMNTARQTLAIYAPLANRLGIGQLKWELEDRAFSALHQEQYRSLIGKLQERRVDRDTYIDNCISKIHSALEAQGIVAEIQGRAKHLYSIWRKMESKDLPFESLFDITALRLMVRDIATCYGALDVIHRLWKPLPSEFSDYIATPKKNGYQSIHTVVETPEGKYVEVQIRTYAMHEESEMGVAAHWRYKEGSRHDAHFSQRLNWFRSLLAWQQELAQKERSFEEAHMRVMDDYVYVFTPVGDVMALPTGATPVDFAYAVHTQVGHKCRGAKANGTIVPLTYILKTGDRVEVITGNEARPSRDWLSSKTHYVRSERTRTKIARWFRLQYKEDHIRRGKDLMQKALSGKPTPKPQALEQVAEQFNYQALDDLYASIGAGDLGCNTVLNVLEEHARAPEKPLADESLEHHYEKPAGTFRQQAVVVHGVDNVLTRTAGCCRPVKGDDIVGYITQGQGVTVHRMDCAGLHVLQEKSPERLVPVDWGDQARSSPSCLQVIGAADPFLLKSITTLLAQEEYSLLSLNSHKRKNETLVIDITLEVPDKDTLERIKTQLRQMPLVQVVKRV